MKISIIGLGYIGLPTATMFASKDIEVVGVDINQEIVDTLNSGNIHIVEPGLEPMVKQLVNIGKLRASTDVERSDVFIIAVPTPFKDKHEPDLYFVETAAMAIAPFLQKGNLVIIESTSPVGTTQQISMLLQKNRSDLSFPKLSLIDPVVDCDVFIAYCPERVLPGKIMHELVKNDRIIGGITRKCALMAKEVYKKFVEGECILTDARTAEMCKLAENSFRDINIAFANELSIICDELHINVWELIRLANHHPRVNILQPGPGVGGHCIAVDPWFIVNSVPKHAKLIKIAREVNDSKPQHIVEKVKKTVQKIKKDYNETSIAILGLAFKADVNDLRESPAVAIAKELTDFCFKQCNIVEPNISCLPKDFNGNFANLTTLEEAVVIADIILLLVDHTEFKNIDAHLLLGKQIIDTRGVFNYL